MADSSSADKQQEPDRSKARMMLIPFFLLVLVFFYVYNPLMHLPPETLTAALCKTAPIWYLWYYVGMSEDFRNNGAAIGARVGLAFSSLGDICLVWRVTLFLPGMFFFALAQGGYIVGLSSWLSQHNWKGGQYTREFSLACVLSYLFVFTGVDSWIMAICLLGYSCLLFAMANLAVQRHLMEGSEGSWAGAVGGICFAVSDLLIAVHKFKMHVPFSEGLIMLTYYGAQVAIAYGAVMSVRVGGGKEKKEKIPETPTGNDEDMFQRALNVFGRGGSREDVVG